MAVRRPSMACLSCQMMHPVISRRRLPVSTRVREESSISLPPTTTTTAIGFRFSGEENVASQSDVIPLSPQNAWPHLARDHREELDHRLRMHLQDLDGLWRTKASRQETLRRLSNPFPGPPGHIRQPRQESRAHLNLNTTIKVPVPHCIFRQILSDASAIGNTKTIRQILRTQLLHCEVPKDILRIVAVSMQQTLTAQNLACLYEPMIRALYRCRAKVSDPEILRTFNIIVGRLRIANLPVSQDMLQVGLKFAARARSLQGMQRFLRLIRQSGYVLSSHTFRSVIAKFSIGHRGLGEIRNGRWRRDELLQVLNGFENEKHLPPEQRNHLEMFLDRNDWQYLHGWVAVTARCRDAEGVWREWKRWKESDARLRPKKLASMSGGLTSKVRGDFWFVEQMAYSGDYEKAWKLLGETDISFSILKVRVKSRLLDGVAFAPSWTEDIRKALLQKYDADLSAIEAALGVRWVHGQQDGEGVHEQTRLHEDALERLGGEEWSLSTDYGYPSETDETEMALQHAEERGLADSAHTKV